jgi:hypothetical protein
MTATAADGLIDGMTRDEIEQQLRQVGAADGSAGDVIEALARLVRGLRRGPWVEGDLVMELAPEGASTAVRLFADREDRRETLASVVTIAVALDELEEAVHGAPDLFAPLVMRHHRQRLVFTTRGFAVAVPPPGSYGPPGWPEERPTRKDLAFVSGEIAPAAAHAAEWNT